MSEPIKFNWTNNTTGEALAKVNVQFTISRRHLVEAATAIVDEDIHAAGLGAGFTEIEWPEYTSLEEFVTGSLTPAKVSQRVREELCTSGDGFLEFGNSNLLTDIWVCEDAINEWVDANFPSLKRTVRV